jgi:undecaprenyl-diphosphatase
MLLNERKLKGMRLSSSSTVSFLISLGIAPRRPASRPFETIPRLSRLAFSSRQPKRLVLFQLMVVVFFIVPVNGETRTLLSRIDRDVFDALYDAPPQRQPLGSIMEGVAEAGDYRTILGLSIVFMAYGGEKHRETGRLLASTYGVSALAVFGGKQVSRRTRPLDKELGDSSFPSGHTAYAFACATILGSQYPKLRIPLYIVAGLVGLSRVYLGRHYPSDVIGGAAIGTIGGMLVLRYKSTLLSWEF